LKVIAGGDSPHTMAWPMSSVRDEGTTQAEWKSPQPAKQETAARNRLNRGQPRGKIQVGQSGASPERGLGGSLMEKMLSPAGILPAMPGGVIAVVRNRVISQLSAKQ